MDSAPRPPYEEQVDCGFVYYTRYFRGVQPQRRGPALTPVGTISILTLLGDNDTWSITLFSTTGDQPLKALREDRTPPQPADDLARSIRGLFGAMMASPDLFRCGLEYIGTVTPVQRILERPAVVDGLRGAREAMKNAPPPPTPGPNRRQLLDLIVSAQAPDGPWISSSRVRSPI